MNFKDELTKYIDIINNELTKYLKKEDCPEHILNESKEIGRASCRERV